ncbi:MAG: hypothetical protein HY710_03685 [Candidatus Latescibacteria bacterium]|nr:hypothetical protein [Candidatus Latescibacterota bacterium]
METGHTQAAIVSVDSPMPPPPWALLERELIRVQSLACQEFYRRYFDERGYLLCVERWGGDDGADDAIENLTGWPILHALGGPDIILEMCKQAQNGHIRQYTEAKTVEVPFARDGMYYKEFPVMFDWLHNGESLSVFHVLGLSDPGDLDFQRRVRRFAGLYMNEDPQAPNYDPEHRLIRSMFNGSRGPLLRKATALDWTGDPIEEGRFILAHGERNYQEMLAHFQDYNDVGGDHPLNLVATGLALNAYMLTGEAQYRTWLLEYVDAWVERTRANGGVIPSNIGLDGTIGGACDGKWYGGTYGWGFTVVVPQTGDLAHRNIVYMGIAGFGNALLLTGDQRYVEVWRRMLDSINANQKVIDGAVMYPHMYGEQGWYDYTPQPYAHGALEVYYWSMADDDLKRLPMTGWVAFLEGQSPNYPVEALQQDFSTIRQRMERVRNDPTTPDTRLSDNPNGFNPAVVGTLVELMLGGLPPRNAQPLHCRVRYFDPVRRRAGIPEDVAALVDTLTADETGLTLVNVNPADARTVVIQGGAYAEHQVVSVEIDGQRVPVDGASFTVRLAPGAGSRLVLRMKRYANQPTFEFPWER